MTIRSLRIAATLLCTLPLILSACGGGDTPEDTAADTAQDQPTAAADARAPKQKPEPKAKSAPLMREPSAEAEPGFTDVEWTLDAFEPTQGDAIEPVAEAVPMLQFNSEPGPGGVRRVIGYNGCNRFISNYTIGEDGSLKVPVPLGMTKKSCPENVQRLESAMMKALGNATGYSVEAGKLTIRSESGSLRFSGG